MNEPSIKVMFPNVRSAYQAFDMLEELSYEPEMLGGGETPALAIHIEKHDVQSALEITQAYGGELLEQGEERNVEDCEYEIPAHNVNEDFTESYLAGRSNSHIGDEYDAVIEGYRDSVYE